ncbi:MAG TPA: gluconate 2-dehydrogenase subunit 3 family protein [Gemmatimonadaceae bacterium]|nr:gluconate 2-dehydrogenase subunit 3 family protein [Gemmatimonadaceae bacterium]
MLPRRDFVSTLGTGLGAAWLAAIWPDALADAAEADRAATTGAAAQFRTITAQQAADFAAVADRIIPADETPGARDAGVAFFADRFLGGMGSGQKAEFDKAIAAVNAAAKKRVPTAASFAALTVKQQDETLTSIQSGNEFSVLRAITVAGYFSHPSHGGNRNDAGWRTIGIQDRMQWSPPFGYYDQPEVMTKLLPRKS